MKYITFVTILALGASLPPAMAQDRVELESIFIKGNKEFPQILYIVPWKDMQAADHKEQTLILHSLFGDLFDPVYQEIENGSHQATPAK